MLIKSSVKVKVETVFPYKIDTMISLDMHWKITAYLHKNESKHTVLDGHFSKACIFDILYVFNYICVFCNWNFSDVIKLCKVYNNKKTPFEGIFVL